MQVDAAGTLLNHVVRMHDETDQTTASKDLVAFRFPKVNRVIAEHVKQGVILGHSKWKFQDFPDAIRHYGATAAALRFQVSYVGDRHIIGYVQRFEPFLVPIHGARSKTLRLKMAQRFVDFRHLPEELGAVLEERSVVFQIVNIHFKPTTTNSLEVVRANLIPSSRNDLEGCLDPIGIIDFHQAGGEANANCSLNVVRHN